MANHRSPKPGLPVRVGADPIPFDKEWGEMKEKLNALVQYLKETRAETKKVVWPDRRYITVATVIILILSIVTGLYVTVVDFALTKIFGVLIK